MVEGLSRAWPLIDDLCTAAKALASPSHPPDAFGVAPTATSPRPSVFISWAHSHRTWDTERASQWQSQVVKFALSLRANGIDADLDLFHLDDPSVDWTRFGPLSVKRAGTVVIVMSQAWSERWEGTNEPREGAGAVAEADELLGLFSSNQEAFQRKCLLVLFPEVAPEDVPPRLARLNRFTVDPYDLDSYEALFRTLTGQPRLIKPALGPTPILPALAAEENPSVDDYQRRAAAASMKRRRLDAQGADDAAREDAAMREATIRGMLDSLLE